MTVRKIQSGRDLLAEIMTNSSRMRSIATCSVWRKAVQAPNWISQLPCCAHGSPRILGLKARIARVAQEDLPDLPCPDRSQTANEQLRSTVYPVSAALYLLRCELAGV